MKLADNKLFKQYVLGFVLSLILTMAAYVLVAGTELRGTPLYLSLGGLALVQMLVQLVYFLHVAEEARPRWRLLSLVFMTIILLIIVVGTLWIMHHLNYNMMEMSNEAKHDYMMEQKDKGF